MNNILKTLIIILSFASLMACQTTNKKVATDSSLNDQKQGIAELLKSITATAIQNQEYEQASKGIFGLILSDDIKLWDFIQSALFSLPRENAFQLMEKIISHNSVKDSSEKLYQLSKVYISLQNQDLALSTVNQAIEKDNNNLEALYWRARLNTVKKDYENAELDFEYIIKKAPKNQEYKEQFASFLQETKQFDKAQKTLSQLTPTPKNLFKAIVFALQNKNNQKANSAFEDLLNIDVDETNLDQKNFLVAEGAYWLEKYDISKEHYKLVKGGDNYLDARQMLTHILYEEKQYDEAIELLHQLQNAEEEYAIKAYLLESQIYRQQEDIDSAINTLDLSLELIPKNEELLYARSMAFEASNNMTKAIKDLKQIISNNPQNAEAYNALGYSMADHDMNLEEALGYIKQAIELDPGNAAIIDSLGWAYYKLGNYNEAEIQLLKALSKDLNDIEIYMHLHKTQLKLEKTTEAAKTLQQAKEVFPENDKLKDYIKDLN